MDAEHDDRLDGDGVFAVPPPMTREQFEAAQRNARRSVRRKVILAAVVTAISVGVSVMSCVGQSFSYRQAKAMESIDHRLELILDRCTTTR